MRKRKWVQNFLGLSWVGMTVLIDVLLVCLQTNKVAINPGIRLNARNKQAITLAA